MSSKGFMFIFPQNNIIVVDHGDISDILWGECFLLTITTQLYIVTGGHWWKQDLDLVTTEILKKEGGTSWQIAASLPSKRLGTSGLSLPNGHFIVSGEDCLFNRYIPSYDISWCIITGGQQGIEGIILADVLDYDPDEDKWTSVGQLATARDHHAMGLVPAETADYCV